MAEEKKVSKDRGKWFREMRSELKKVVWPDGKTTAKNTGTVLLCSLIVGHHPLPDDSWHVIRNLRGVPGCGGAATKAIPLTEDEVAALGVEKREIVVLYHVGDTVRITEGPLSSFTGTVEEIEPEKNRVRVVVSMFGRETPVDLELDQVEVSAN